MEEIQDSFPNTPGIDLFLESHRIYKIWLQTNCHNCIDLAGNTVCRIVCSNNRQEDRADKERTGNFLAPNRHILMCCDVLRVGDRIILNRTVRGSFENNFQAIPKTAEHQPLPHRVPRQPGHQYLRLLKLVSGIHGELFLSRFLLQVFPTQIQKCP